MKHLLATTLGLTAMLLLGGCTIGRSLSQIAREATPTINALLTAGKNNDVSAGLQTFTGSSQSESTLKALFNSRRDVFDNFTPLRAEDASYSSISGGFLGASAQFEARIPNVAGVSLRANVVDQNGWKLSSIEFFKTN
jgi:hypothetical protein